MEINTDVVSAASERGKREEVRKQKEKLTKAAPLLLRALEIAYLEMQYVNRPQSQIARKKALAALIKAGGKIV